MKYINLYTADNSYEANFIKDNLEDAGIKCMVTNENFTTLMPHMNGMLGSGIQILVDKDDFERATQILDKGKNRDTPVCPTCNSTNVKYGLGTNHRLKKMLAIFIALVIASPVRHIRQTYYCRDCKTEFGK
jgi:Putative prokaryotic signal transducing protein